MNLLQMINRACVRAKMPTLTALTDDTNTQAREYLEYANQAREDMISFWKWRALAKDWTVTTENQQQEITLPADFDGLLVNQIYDRTRNLYLQNADDDVSLENRAGKYMPDIPFWRVIGKKIVFDFPLQAGRELLLAYQSKYAVVRGDETRGELFAYTNDTYLLDEQALIAGILYEKSAAYQDEDLQFNKDRFYTLCNTAKERDGANRKINIFGHGVNRISPTNFQPYNI